MRAARAALCLAVLCALAGCGPDPRQAALCEAILPALLGDNERAQDIQAASDPAQRHGVAVSFTTDGEARTLTCAFGGGRLGAERLRLRAVSLDGQPLSFARMVFLWRAFGLEPPADIAEPPPAAPPMSPARATAYFLQQLINGLALGAVFALIAVGYSLVYGISGTIQFAFGEVFMIGAYLVVIMLAASAALGLGPAPAALLLTLAVGGLVTAVYGWSIERLIYRPLRGAAALAPLIAAIGLSIALREFVRLAQGAGNQWLPNLLPARFSGFDGGGFPVTLSGMQLLIFALTLAASLALGAVVTRTRLGRAQRACADDPGMAALLGVDVDRTIAIAFALGAALAALAGFAVALYYGEVDPNIGYLAGFKALTAALLGGFGSIAGALAGGLLLGLFETFWSGYLGGDYKDAAVFAVLILVLIFRPQGLFGAATRPREGDALFPIR